MANDYLRGHEIVQVDGVWRYADTLEPTASTWRFRPCGHCGQPSTLEGHDACVGTLPEITNACCGHGQTTAAYVQFDDGSWIGGRLAVTFLTLVGFRFHV